MKKLLLAGILMCAFYSCQDNNEQSENSKEMLPNDSFENEMERKVRLLSEEFCRCKKNEIDSPKGQKLIKEINNLSEGDVEIKKNFQSLISKNCKAKKMLLK
ncbi:MAG: hypothetical protein ACKO7P_01340 [Bacteroidota bacterium]